MGSWRPPAHTLRRVATGAVAASRRSAGVRGEVQHHPPQIGKRVVELAERSETKGSGERLLHEVVGLDVGRGRDGGEATQGSVQVADKLGVRSFRGGVSSPADPPQERHHLHHTAQRRFVTPAAVVTDGLRAVCSLKCTSGVQPNRGGGATNEQSTMAVGVEAGRDGDHRHGPGRRRPADGPRRARREDMVARTTSPRRPPRRVVPPHRHRPRGWHRRAATRPRDRGAGVAHLRGRRGHRRRRATASVDVVCRLPGRPPRSGGPPVRRPGQRQLCGSRSDGPVLVGPFHDGDGATAPHSLDR